MDLLAHQKIGFPSSQENLKNLLNQGKPFEEAYSACFVLANEQLHKSRIDDSMSGTTAITCLFLRGTLYVANVGDSRAIVGEERNGKLIAYPLSSDQTPFRKDERERCKAAGAIVGASRAMVGVPSSAHPSAHHPRGRGGAAGGGGGGGSGESQRRAHSRREPRGSAHGSRSEGCLCRAHLVPQCEGVANVTADALAPLGALHARSGAAANASPFRRVWLVL